MRVLAVVVLMLFTSSCAFFKTVKAPATYEPPAEVTCTTGNTYSAVDFVLGGVVMLGVVGLLGSSASSSKPLTTAEQVGITAGFAGLAAPFVASGIYGLSHTAKCRELAKRLKDYEYQQFAAQKVMLGAGLGARSDAPVPADSLNGKTVLTWAVVQGQWKLAAMFSDGWRDLSGDRIPTSTVSRSISSSETPVELGPLLVRPPGLDYRGEEGWQGLKWGATTEEVGASFTVTPRVVSPNITELVGEATVLETPATVTFTMYRGRLAGVYVGAAGATRRDWEQALQTKYGEGQSTRLLVTRWVAKETTIVLNGESLYPTILYTSLLWSVFIGPEYERLERAKAQKDL